MFDNLREESSKDFEEQAQYQPAASTVRKKSKRFLGMTSIQRFILMLLIMSMVCVLGTLILLATGKFVF